MTPRAARHERGRRARRLLLAAFAATALAASVGGCVIFRTAPTSSQLNIIGGVQVTTTFCASDKNSTNTGYNPADASCQGASHLGNEGQSAANNTNVQLMIAYRIPSTITSGNIPTSFTSTNTSNPPTTACGGGITFNQSSSYTSQLQSLSPAPNGEQWVGYISTGQNYTTAGCQYITVAPTFGVTQGNSTAPFQGPFTYRAVVGFREYDDTESGSGQARTVTCGSSLYTLFSDGNGGDQQGICIDDPNSTTVATDLSQTTRDLGVIPTNTSVHAGATATVPFNLKYAGASGSGAFTVAASTTVPSTTATPSITTLTPAADSNNNMTVSVPVPVGTTPQGYTVTVTATLANGQQRTGVATLTVNPSFAFDPQPGLPSLGTIALNGQSQTQTAKMNNFGVNDTTSTHTGWNVTVNGDSSAGKKPTFWQYCSNGANPCGSDAANSYVAGGKNLVANSLTLNTTGSTWSGGTNSAPTFSCASGCFVDAASPQKIASASANNGTSLWSTSFASSSLSLAIPSTTYALPANEIYHLDVVWTLNSGP